MTRKPNVLIIMTDEHRPDLMTCAGRSTVPTPHLDRIAERGVRFENAYCSNPVCAPSRMSMMSGLYSHNTGVVDNLATLDWRMNTMPHHFAANDYLTALIGKMHFSTAHNHGFEYYMSINDWLMYLGPKVGLYANEIANHTICPRYLETAADFGSGFPDLEDIWDTIGPWASQVEHWEYDDVASKMDACDHLDMFVARETVKFLRKYQDQPFFAVASFMKPHCPNYPPREYAARYPVESMELPPIGDISRYPNRIQRNIESYQNFGEQKLKATRAGYLGNLAFVDDCIGKVYDELESLGLLDNTIVVYTSDHGDMDGDHGLYAKFTLYEPSAKVPMIVSWPRTLPEGEVSRALVEQIGLWPTLSDLAGLTMPQSTCRLPFAGAPDRFDGVSFAQQAGSPHSDGAAVAFSEFAINSPVAQYMARGPRFKYIHSDEPGDNELYDLEADPNESINRIDDPALEGQIDVLKEALGEFRDRSKRRYALWAR